MTQLDLFDRRLVQQDAKRKANLRTGLDERIGGDGQVFNRPSAESQRKGIFLRHDDMMRNRTRYAYGIIDGPFVRLGVRLDAALRLTKAWLKDWIWRRLVR